MEGCLERYSGKPIREWDDDGSLFFCAKRSRRKMSLDTDKWENECHSLRMDVFIFFFCDVFLFLVCFLHVLYIFVLFFKCIFFWIFCFAACVAFFFHLVCISANLWWCFWNLTDLRKLGWYHDFQCWSKQNRCYAFVFIDCRKARFFFALCDASFVFDFAIYFPDSFLFLKGRMLLRCCFLFPCYVCRFPPKAVHTMDAVPFLCLHFICCLFFTGSLNRRKMWNLVKTLFFCRFYPIGLFSFPSLCIESFADGFLPMRISSFLFYFCILCTRHMMAYNSWIWTSTWWANFSSWLVSFLNICASVVSFNLHFFCICAVHHWFCTLPVRLSVCVCVRVSVCALAFVHHL